MMTVTGASIENVSKIVVHGGSAHPDDLYCVMLALQFVDAPVYRRDPRPEELADPAVLCLDVGKQYEPRLRNFDHHQDEAQVRGECALSLFAEHLGLRRMFETQRWWKPTVMQDAAGPFAVAKALELPRFPFELESPMELALLEMFEQTVGLEVGGSLYTMIKKLGRTWLRRAERFATRYDEIKAMAKADDPYGCLTMVGATVTGERSVPGWLIESKLSGSDLYETLQWLHDREHPDIGFVMFWSERGEGWDVFRFNDHPALDFSRLDGKAGVDFAHPVGFFAQLAERTSWQDALLLASQGLIPPAKD